MPFEGFLQERSKQLVVFSNRLWECFRAPKYTKKFTGRARALVESLQKFLQVSRCAVKFNQDPKGEARITPQILGAVLAIGQLLQM